MRERDDYSCENRMGRQALAKSGLGTENPGEEKLKAWFVEWERDIVWMLPFAW